MMEVPFTIPTNKCNSDVLEVQAITTLPKEALLRIRAVPSWPCSEKHRIGKSSSIRTEVHLVIPGVGEWELVEEKD